MMTYENKPAKVFVLESEPHKQFLYRDALSGQFELSFFENEHDCFHQLLQAYTPDALIASRADGGINLLQRVRNTEWTQNLPVIITTAKSSEGLKKEVLNLKGNDIYPSLPDFDILSKRIELLVQKAHKNSESKISMLKQSYQLPLWKRVIDVSTTGLALLLLSPLLILVAIAIKLDSKGPVIYKSKRVGAGYRIFSIYKFRTMRTDADKLIKNMGNLNLYAKEAGMSDKQGAGLCDDCRATGECKNMLFKDGAMVCEKNHLMAKSSEVAFMKFQNDPRITRLGKFLRNTSIDELPQLFNIFLGDMSLIGNRPLPLYEAEKLTTDKYIERFAGPGGLTGLWQVTKRGKGKQDMTEEERINLDIEYARNFSFLFDMKIFFKTFPALLQTENV